MLDENFENLESLRVARTMPEMMAAGLSKKEAVRFITLNQTFLNGEILNTKEEAELKRLREKLENNGKN